MSTTSWSSAICEDIMGKVAISALQWAGTLSSSVKKTYEKPEIFTQLTRELLLQIPLLYKLWTTPRKSNIERENDGLEDDFPENQGCILSFHVNLPGCIPSGEKSSQSASVTWQWSL